MKNAVEWVFYCCVIFAMVSIVFITCNVIQAKGNIDSCYIEGSRGDMQSFVVYGNIDWRVDAFMAKAVNLEDAVNITKTLGCNLK